MTSFTNYRLVYNHSGFDILSLLFYNFLPLEHFVIKLDTLHRVYLKKVTIKKVRKSVLLRTGIFRYILLFFPL